MVNVFDWTNLGGHGTTRYDRWLTVNRRRNDDNEDEVMMDINCFRSNRYEPYLAFRYCDNIPPFQERFEGYGKNKVVWVRQMRRMGYVFQQLLGFGGGGGFLVHYPHANSKSRNEWNRRPKALSPGTLPKDVVFAASSATKVEVLEAATTGGKERGGDEGVVDWMAYQRGRVDSLYLDFREWLEEEVVDETQTPICGDSGGDGRIGGGIRHNQHGVRGDDDVKLWVDQKRIRLHGQSRKKVV